MMVYKCTLHSAISDVLFSRSLYTGDGKPFCVSIYGPRIRETHREVLYHTGVHSLLLQTYFRLNSTYLVSGTVPSALASQVILAALVPDKDYAGHVDPSDTVFARLGLLRSVALKVKESAVNERSVVSKPAREVREVLKGIAAQGEESLVGIF